MEVTRAARPTNCCAAAFCSSAYILYTGTNFYEYFHTTKRDEWYCTGSRFGARDLGRLERRGKVHFVCQFFSRTSDGFVGSRAL